MISKIEKVVKIIICLVAIFLLLVAKYASAAILFLDTQTQDLGINQEFEVTLGLNPQGQVLNALEGQISYSSNLDLISINDGDSIITFWIERPTLKEGSVVFSGIIPGGYAGDISPYWEGARAGKIFKSTFKTKNPGPANINLENTRVLLNDGQGTEAPLTNVSLNLEINKEARPSAAVSPKDTEPPEVFSPQIVSDPNIFSNQWFLVWSAKDVGSGIDHYEAKEVYGKWYWRGLINQILKRERWETSESPYLIKDQNLKSFIYIKAVDRAGNEQISAISPKFGVLWYENYLIWFIIIIIFLAISYLIRRIIWGKRQN